MTGRSRAGGGGKSTIVTPQQSRKRMECTRLRPVAGYASSRAWWVTPPASDQSRRLAENGSTASQLPRRDYTRLRRFATSFREEKTPAAKETRLHRRRNGRDEGNALSDEARTFRSSRCVAAPCYIESRSDKNTGTTVDTRHARLHTPQKTHTIYFRHAR